MTRLCEKDLLLATAESCTGGLLASLFTDVDGAGHGFDRGFVTYTEAAKSELLGISPELIKERNAVSEEVARAMAEGALEHSRADIIAIAVTGWAGPGEDVEEEGRVHLALATRGVPTFHRCEHYGARGRGGVRIDTIRTALDMLAEALGRSKGWKRRRQRGSSGSTTFGSRRPPWPTSFFTPTPCRAGRSRAGCWRRSARRTRR